MPSSAKTSIKACPSRASESTISPSKSKSRPLRASEVILDPDDVVLAEVLPVLHLDEDEELGSGIRDAVCGAERDVDGRACRNLHVDAVERDEPLTLDAAPILRA